MVHIYMMKVWQSNDLELVLSYVVNNNETVTFTVKNRFYGINFDSRKTLKNNIRQR